MSVTIEHSNCCIATFRIVVIHAMRIAGTSERNWKTRQKFPDHLHEF